ncbi:hypothetical protein FBQ85_12860 [Cytophagia bacterium CHB2]|nr:hypothetical protein [Cytophagia bacterium CHB2]
MVYPIETLYTLANHRADAAAAEIFKLLLTLLDHHHHVDVVSHSIFTKGKWKDQQFILDENVHDAVIFPYAEILSKATAIIQQNGAGQTHYAFSEPHRLLNSQTVALPIDHRAKNSVEVLSWLQDQPKLRPVKAPNVAWVSLTRMPGKNIITLTPWRHRGYDEGEVSYAEKVVSISHCEKLSRVIFSEIV